MTEPVVWALAAAAGAVVGAAYAACLWAGVRALTAGGGGGRFALFAALRAALILGALALAVAAELGAGAILAGLAGFVAVRLTVTRRVRDGEGAPWR
ncbi:hypothetical protein DRV84_07985 [Rhodosalinus sediminis]|jgi:hypothetical protein|uniref:ATP synthase subunit I n=1 Tax=Rhodosalinus sediminis TaxID=1940533 RepID=A0A3D9BV14_9RHOB|nr:ATP synthase subunit I [Rhodosalinus sediminis]REC57374.1 hypothetical protein DRV84_07985 [Rhodosalinus sediminis]